MKPSAAFSDKAGPLRYRDHSIRADLISLPGEKYIPDDWLDVSMAAHAGVRTLCYEGMVVVLIWHPLGWDVIAYGNAGLKQDTWPDSDLSAALIGLLD